MDIAAAFREQTAPGYFIRINAEHPLDIYLGIDDNNHYSLEFRGAFTAQSVKACNSIGVHQYASQGYSSIVFFLKDQKMFDTFCVFCTDIIEATNTTYDEEAGYRILINRYFSWRKMFQGKPTRLQEQDIMGLIGELIFLRDYMIPTYGEDSALLSWSGSELTHKDFSLKETWFEVKAVSSGKNSVKISSLEQLQSQIEGELVIFHLEKMSPVYDGVSLNKLANGILGILSNDFNRDSFLNKLAENRYDFDTAYDEFVYEINLGERYQVTASFPKLTTEDVNEAICKVQYEILLSEIQGYKIDWEYGN